MVETSKVTKIKRDISHVWRDSHGRWTDTPGIGDDAPPEETMSEAEASRRKLGVEQEELFPNEPELYPTELEIAESGWGLDNLDISDVDIGVLNRADKGAFTADQWLGVFAREFEKDDGSPHVYADMEPEDWRTFFESSSETEELLFNLMQNASFDQESALKVIPALDFAINDTLKMADFYGMDDSLARAWLKVDPDQWIEEIFYEGGETARDFFESFGDEFEKMIDEGDLGEWEEKHFVRLTDFAFEGGVDGMASIPEWFLDTHGPQVNGVGMSDFFSESPREAIELSPTYRRLGYSPSYDKISEADYSADSAIENWAYANGLNPRLSEMLAEDYIQRNVVSMPVATRADPEDALAILREGRFKSQHETGDTNGAFAPGVRMRAEFQGLGLEPPEAEYDEEYGEEFSQVSDFGFGQFNPEEDTPRPIYGYMLTGFEEETGMVKPGGGGRVSQYGSVEFIFKNEVRSRTTFTVGDSLDKWATGNNGVSVGVPVLAERTRLGWDNRFDELMSGVKQNKWHPPYLEYFEAQIHGNVMSEDIGMIRFTGYGQWQPLDVYASIIDEAEAQGIEWSPSSFWSLSDFFEIAVDTKSQKFKNAYLKRLSWADESEVSKVRGIAGGWGVDENLERVSGVKKSASKLAERDISHVWRDSRGRWTDTPGIGDGTPPEETMAEAEASSLNTHGLQVNGVPMSDFVRIDELDEVALSPTYAKLGYSPPIDQLSNAKFSVNAALDAYEIDTGISQDVTEAMAENYIQKNVLPMPVATRADPEDALSILRDGRFKTQQETLDTNGSFSPAVRMEAEYNGLGIEPPEYNADKVYGDEFQEVELFGYGQFNPKEDTPRPIYGYMLTGYDANTGRVSKWAGGQVAQYGAVEFIFEDEVKSRTTFTVGDSLDKWYKGYDDMSVGVPLDARRTKLAWDSRLRELMDGVNEGAVHPNRLEYFEAQIHGVVTTGDIAKIRFTGNGVWKPLDVYASIIDEAEYQGIAWEPSEEWSLSDYFEIAVDTKSQKFRNMYLERIHKADDETRVKARQVAEGWGVDEFLERIDGGKKKSAGKAIERDISHVWRDSRGRWTDTPGIGDDALEGPREGAFVPVPKEQMPLFDASDYDIFGDWEKLSLTEKEERAPEIRRYADFLLRQLRDVAEYNEDGEMLGWGDSNTASGMLEQLDMTVGRLHEQGKGKYHMTLSDYADILINPEFDNPEMEFSSSVIETLLKNDMVSEMTPAEYVTYFMGTDGAIRSWGNDAADDAYSELDFHELASFFEEHTPEDYLSVVDAVDYEKANETLQEWMYLENHQPTMNEWSEILVEDMDDFDEVVSGRAGLGINANQFANYYMSSGLFDVATSELKPETGPIGMKRSLLFFGQMERIGMEPSYDVMGAQAQQYKDFPSYAKHPDDAWFELSEDINDLKQIQSESTGANLFTVDEFKTPVAAFASAMGKPKKKESFQYLSNIIGSIGLNGLNAHRYKGGIDLLKWQSELQSGNGVVEALTGTAMELSKEDVVMQENIVRQYDSYLYTEDGITNFNEKHNVSRQKDQIAKSLEGTEGISYGEASGFIEGWAHTSNDNDLRALSIQAEAADMWDAKMSEWQQERFDEVIGDRDRSINLGHEPSGATLYHFEDYKQKNMFDDLTVDYGFTEKDLPTIGDVTKKIESDIEENNKFYPAGAYAARQHEMGLRRIIEDYKGGSFGDRVRLADQYKFQTQKMKGKIIAVHNLPTTEEYEVGVRETVEKIESGRGDAGLSKELIDTKVKDYVSEYSRSSPDRRVDLVGEANYVRDSVTTGKERAFPEPKDDFDVKLNMVGLPSRGDVFQANVDRFKASGITEEKRVHKVASENARDYINARTSNKVRLADDLGFDVSKVNLPEDLLEDSSSVSRRKIRSVLTEMHKRTQDWFVETGATHVRLYRGVTMPEWELDDIGEPGDIIQIDENTLESWTHSQDRARSFAKGAVGDDPQGVVLETYVPIERVLSNSRTGFGCLSEDEFVIIGVSGRSYVRLISKERG